MRRIVALAGPAAQFAAADDGTHWYWTGVAWEPWTRPPLPQPQAETVVTPEIEHDLAMLAAADRLIEANIRSRKRSLR